MFRPSKLPQTVFPSKAQAWGGASLPWSGRRNTVSAHLEEPTDADELVGGWHEHEHEHDPTAEAPTDDGPDDAPTRPAPTRKGRPSVPSWDDIVFGTRGGGSG